jgi:hypothetical protein
MSGGCAGSAALAGYFGAVCEQRRLFEALAQQTDVKAQVSS